MRSPLQLWGLLHHPGRRHNADTRQPAAKTQSLFTARTVLYYSCDGMQFHQAGWKKTAAYESLMESGLWDFAEKLLKQIGEKAKSEGADFDQLRKGIELVTANGLSAAVSLETMRDIPVPVPQALVVFHDAASLAPALSELFKKSGAEEIKPMTIAGRKVSLIPVPDSPPGLAISWWVESEHLVFGLGINVPQNTITAIVKGAPNITSHPLWKEHRDPKPDFEVLSRAWIDLPQIRAAYENIPVPVPNPSEKVTVKDFVTILGLDTAGPFLFASGYKDRALWSESRFDLKGPRKGLLALIDQTPFTLADLPGIPAECSSFAAASFNPSKAYDTILGLARQFAKFGHPQAIDQVEGTIDAIPAILGFDPKKDLLDCFGNVHMGYVDPKHGIFGFGGNIALQVKDPKQLQITFDQILDRVKAELAQVDEKQFQIVTTEKQGRKITTFQVMAIFNPSLCIDKNWLTIALSPQGIESFVSRQEGKLSRWKPTEEEQAGLKLLPEKFTSLSITDPRVAYETLIGMAPMLLGAMKQAAAEGNAGAFPLDIAVADFPSAELVGKPLFPNITISTIDANGIRTTTRQSSPSIPLLGNMNGAATVGVLTALLLPAVQQARTAARETQSKNNMKQIMLALHNFHDTYNSLPRGTIDNKDLKPEERLSWLVSILPFMEQNAIYARIDQKQGWKAEVNKKSVSTLVPQYANPNRPGDVKVPGFAQADYAGLAGLGEEQLTAEKITEKSGVFGYNRTTRLADITDGTSNTIAITEISRTAGAGPWAAGRKGTLRALTKKPYFNGPDGIGGYRPGGTDGPGGQLRPFHQRQNRPRHPRKTHYHPGQRSHRRLLTSMFVVDPLR
ncbi:MAG: DUF1559 domain-containing protein [Planctomycetales bacterium]